jgi:hypothetical protein
MSRLSTPYLLVGTNDVDARDKPRHDELINMRFALILKNSLSAGRERE